MEFPQLKSQSPELRSSLCSETQPRVPVNFLCEPPCVDFLSQGFSELSVLHSRDKNIYKRRSIFRLGRNKVKKNEGVR